MSAPSLAEAMLQLAEACAALIEICNGHRARLLAAGWSDEHAAVAVLDLHSNLLRKCFA